MEAILSAAIPYLISAAAAGIAWLGKEAGSLLRTKAKNETAARAMESFTHLVSNTVAEVEMSKAGLTQCFKEGKLTQEGKAYLKKKAVDAVLAQLPKSTGKVVSSQVSDLKAYTGTKVEKAVMELKQAGPLALISGN